MSSNASSLISQSQFIRAGAGAGKTTRLISTFLDFAQEFKRVHGRLPRVVMTTFTRKATQEIKERLLVGALQRKDTEVFKHINQRSQVHISTIHGLLSLFLSQNAAALKFPLEIKITDGPQQLRTFKKQINELLKTNDEFLRLLEVYRFNDLVDVSRSALEQKAQHKTFARLSQKDLEAHAASIRSKFSQAIDEVLRFSSTANDKWIEYLKFLAALKLCVQNDDLQGAAVLIEEKPKKPAFKAASPSIDPVADEVLRNDVIPHFESLWPDERTISAHEELNRVFEVFIDRLFSLSYEHKRRTGELSISDLETLSLKILDEHPQAADEFASSWDYFMIDEYQDTSPLQVKILNGIVRNRCCFIVGDPQQSIYLFRGARSEVFDIKQNELEKIGAKIDFLQTNYRSEPALMHFINDFFADLSRQFRSMTVKPERGSELLALDADVFFVTGEDQVSSAIQHIKKFLNAGAQPADICVLSRSNRNLESLAVAAKRSGLNIQLQTASGFDLKREIIDLIAFAKFLNNPHDDENFVTLVRGPWVNVTDDELVNWADHRVGGRSFWSSSARNTSEVVGRLKFYLEFFDTAGALQTVKRFIADTDFLTLSEYYDSTGKREANISKFLCRLAEAERTPGFSLGQFLDEQFAVVSVEGGGANSEAQPVVQPDCVSLMTVHASKGLQFKHVIIIGMADTLQYSRTPLFSFEAETGRFSLGPADPETLKPNPVHWAQELNKTFVEREKAESERVLYVAMTRGIQTVSLVAGTARKPPSNTWYARINWPEPESASQTKPYRVKSLSYEKAIVFSEKTTKSFGNVRDRFAAATEELDLSASVTDLIGKSATSVTAADAAAQIGFLKKAQYGTDLHRVFESLKYVDIHDLKAMIDDRDVKALNYLGGLRDIPFFEVLKNGFNEWGFGVQTPNRVLPGQIDLWAELEDAVYVVDYKTGSSKYVDKAMDQLSVYTKALLVMGQISKNKKIVHAVIYPLEESTEIRSYADAVDFENRLHQKVKDLF